MAVVPRFASGGTGGTSLRTELRQDRRWGESAGSSDRWPHGKDFEEQLSITETRIEAMQKMISERDASVTKATEI